MTTQNTVYALLAIAMLLGTAGGLVEKFAKPDSLTYKIGVVLASLGVDLASIGKMLGAGAMLLVIGLSTSGCQNGAPTPQTVSTVNAGVQLALCVWNAAAADEAQGMSGIQLTADLIAKCGTDAATVATLLDARAKAKVSPKTSCVPYDSDRLLTDLESARIILDQMGQ